MKTRIISITMGVLFAAVTVAGATDNRNQNSSPDSSHEYVTEQNFTDMISNTPSVESNMMEEWIESRDKWEQAEQNTVSKEFLNDSEMLKEWMLSRDNWEQEDQDLTGGNFPVKSSLLEEWIASMDCWEQK